METGLKGDVGKRKEEMMRKERGPCRLGVVDVAEDIGVLGHVLRVIDEGD